ncbi:MAG TPA: MFS transporter [Actinomycetota bacterium]|jgi:DHA1 family inner membrane transport protein|nr:MFS transporter [Actinomycetota bacterium]
MAEGRSTARAVGALLGLAAGTFVYVTTETLPIGLLLLISADLEITPSAAGLLVTWYGLVVVVASLPLTQLTRRVPRRPLLSGLLGVFVLATWASAAASSHWMLLGARVVTALSQALFWAVVVPTAAGLFPPRRRGRVVAVVLGGGTLAAVLGLPLGTWLGQLAGWRAAFLALSGIGLAAMVTVAVWLPAGAPGRGHAARGTHPDGRRYLTLLAMTVLAATGAFAAFTFITPFLIEVSGFPAAATGPLLLVRGVAGIVGVVAGGALVDRRPWAAMLVPVGAQAVALLGLYVLGGTPVAAVALVALSGLAFGALTTALASRVLQVAPGSADLAAAGASTAVNVGITAGALVGSVLLPGLGVRGTALVGGLLSLAALAAALVEPVAAGDRRPAASAAPACDC